MFNNSSRWRLHAYLILSCAYITIAGIGVTWLGGQVRMSVLPESMYQNSFAHQATEIAYQSLANNQFDIDYIVSVVHQLESSGGINDRCKKHGLVNGYGYRQNKRSFKCYDNAEEVKAIVATWFSQKLIDEKLPLPIALCGYNLGFRHPHLQECANQSDRYPYYQNYLKISSALAT